MSGGWTGNDRPGIQKWYTIKRDAQRGRNGRIRGRVGEEGQEPRESRRGRKPLATGRSKAQRREMHHLWLWSGSFAGAPPRPRASEREKENESEGEGETGERGREKGTDRSGREIDVYPPTNTNARGGGRERRVKPSRVGLGQVYPSSTHTALSCVCHPAEENYTKAEAQPLREKEGRRASGRNARDFSKRGIGVRQTGVLITNRRWSVPKSAIVRRKPATVRALSDDASRGVTRGDTSIGIVNNYECIQRVCLDPRIDPARSHRKGWNIREDAVEILRSPIPSAGVELALLTNKLSRFERE